MDDSKHRNSQLVKVQRNKNISGVLNSKQNMYIPHVPQGSQTIIEVVQQDGTSQWWEESEKKCVF